MFFQDDDFKMIRVFSMRCKPGWIESVYSVEDNYILHKSYRKHNILDLAEDAYFPGETFYFLEKSSDVNIAVTMRLLKMLSAPYILVAENSWKADPDLKKIDLKIPAHVIPKHLCIRRHEFEESYALHELCRYKLELMRVRNERDAKYRRHGEV